MKHNNNLKKCALLISVLVSVFIMVACSSNGVIDPGMPSVTPGEIQKKDPTPTPEPTATPLPTPIADMPGNRYNALEQPREAEDEEPVITYLSDNFIALNPFFSESQSDIAVAEKTQLKLFCTDENNEILAGVEYPCLAYSVKELPDNSQFAGGVGSLESNWKAYRIVLKEGITFADGTPVTAEDVMFTVKTLASGDYDGPSAVGTMNIKSMNEYRTRISDDTRKMVRNCLSFGIKEDGTAPDEIISLGETAIAEWTKVWDCFDKAGEEFTADIVEVANSTYTDNAYVQAYLSTSLTYDQVQADPQLRTLFAMKLWGYIREYNNSKKTIKDCFGEIHNLKEEELTPELFWQWIKAYYGYDLSTADGINYESPYKDKKLEDYIYEVYCRTYTEDIPDIFGVQMSSETYEDGAVRSAIDVLIDESENIADFNFYVAEKAFYENDVRSDSLHGAGEYILENAEAIEDGEARYVRITLVANESYLLGSPQKKYLIFTTEPAPANSTETEEATEPEDNTNE